MEELEKIIRESEIEKTSDHFTSTVMERIRMEPVPGPQYSSPVSFWFKLFMVLMFSGSLIWIILSGNTTTNSQPGWIEIFQHGISYVVDFLSVLQSWGSSYTWLLPSFLFTLIGILYLLSGRRGIHYHQYQ